MASPPASMGKATNWALSGIKKCPVILTGHFAFMGAAREAGPALRLMSFFLFWMVLGVDRTRGTGCGGVFVHCQKNVQTRRARSEADRALLVWRSRIRRRRPVPDHGKRFWKGGGKAGQGRPAGPCPLRRRKLRASRAGWRENLFPEKVALPPKNSTARPNVR